MQAPAIAARTTKRFCLILVKPSHYDDDGYVIQWLRSTIPSNSLAAVYGLARDCAERRVLGEDVAIEIHPFDETNTRMSPIRLARMIEVPGADALSNVRFAQSLTCRGESLAAARPKTSRKSFVKT